jgi:hypothetical protein
VPDLRLLIDRLRSDPLHASALSSAASPSTASSPPRGALLALTDTVCRGGDPREISQLLPVLADRGVQADAHLYNSLMKAHVAASAG